MMTATTITIGNREYRLLDMLEFIKEGARLDLNMNREFMTEEDIKYYQELIEAVRAEIDEQKHKLMGENRSCHSSNH